jgi:hypothetical protein
MRKLTLRMEQVLGHLSRGQSERTGCTTMSDCCGLDKVLEGLRTRGLIEWKDNRWAITKLGRQVAKEQGL